MEPGFRPLCPHFLILPTFVTRPLRDFRASAPGIRLKPPIVGFGPQKMCPSCGSITSRSKAFCPECGKSLPALHLW
jgi:predicted amidophosphoribosyltransferase